MTGNTFDRMIVDSDAIFDQWPVAARAHWPCTGPPPPTRIDRLGFVSPRAHHLLTHLRLDQRWFRRFERYWGEVLGGRPLLSPDDFHFLRGLYRVRFQDAAVPDTVDAATHLQAWQEPSLLYHVFHAAFVEGIGPKHGICDLLARTPWRTMLEFGAGAAPVTTTWADFRGLDPDQTVFVSDLPTLAFHYGVYKLRRLPQVIPVPLDVARDFALRLPGPVDAICCITVFEHLPAPAATMRQLDDVLRPGGLFIFDYIRSHGDGLDTAAGIRERVGTLEFIRAHYDIIEGAIDLERSIDLTVARKR